MTLVTYISHSFSKKLVHFLLIKSIITQKGKCEKRKCQKSRKKITKNTSGAREQDLEHERVTLWGHILDQFPHLTQISSLIHVATPA